jgi:hypothetical protein
MQPGRCVAGGGVVPFNSPLFEVLVFGPFGVLLPACDYEIRSPVVVRSRENRCFRAGRCSRGANSVYPTPTARTFPLPIIVEQRLWRLGTKRTVGQIDDDWILLIDDSPSQTQRHRIGGRAGNREN